MALVVKDRVRETTTTSGTGTITLAGAVSGFQSFSVIGNGNTTYYTIVDAVTGAWEVGIGTYTAAGTTLSRDTVLESSNSNNLVNFGTNVKDVFCTYPAERSVYANEANDLVTVPSLIATNVNATTVDATNLEITNLKAKDGTSAGSIADSTGVVSLVANPILSGGTANGVAYLNGSKALTSGSALTFDGTTLTSPQLYQKQNSAATYSTQIIENVASNGYSQLLFNVGANGANGRAAVSYAPGIFFAIGPTENDTTTPLVFRLNNATEQMRLTTTGLGIGTSSPAVKLVVSNAGANGYEFDPANSFISSYNRSTNAWTAVTFRAGSYIWNINNTNDALRLDSSGNVGIGVTPVYQLEVKTANDAILRVINSSATQVSQIQSTNLARSAFAPLTIGGSYTVLETGGTEKVRVTATGEVGIGTSSPQKKLVVSDNGAVGMEWSPTDYTGNMRQLAYNRGTSAYVALRTEASTHEWYIGGNERMRLDSSGNVGIGTTAPNSGDNVGILSVQSSQNFGISIYRNSVNPSQIAFLDNNNSSAIGTNGAGSLVFYNNTRTTERARIDSSGNFGIGTQGGSISQQLAVFTAGANKTPAYFYPNAASSTATPGIRVVKYDNNTTTSQVFIQFAVNQDGANSGQINANGANTAAFGSYSDARLKNNIVDLPPQLDNIMSLRPVEFDYIESEGGGHQIGFIAQEMEQVYPDVVGERSDGMKTITAWSKTEARLVKAIQEQQALIESLTARVAQLEGN